MEIDKIEKQWKAYEQGLKKGELSEKQHIEMAMRVGELIQKIKRLNSVPKKTKKKIPPLSINPNYKPTTVNVEDLSKRLKEERTDILRRAGYLNE